MIKITELVHYLEQIKSKYGNGYVLTPNGKPLEYDHLTPETIIIDKAVDSSTKEALEEYVVFLGKPIPAPEIEDKKKPTRKKKRVKLPQKGAVKKLRTRFNKKKAETSLERTLEELVNSTRTDMLAEDIDVYANKLMSAFDDTAKEDVK